MGTLQSGEIDHLVEFEFGEDALERIASVFPAAGRPEVAEELRHLAFAYHEQLAMVRPDVPDVACIYLTISKHVQLRSIEGLLLYLSELRNSDAFAKPAHAYVYDDLHHVFAARHDDLWFETLKYSELQRKLLKEHALSERARLLDGYRHLQGGLRAHRLGFVVARLRSFLLRAGIKPTASYSSSREVISGALVNLVEAFVVELNAPAQLFPTDLGHLARKVNREAKPGTGAFAKLAPVTGADD